VARGVRLLGHEDEEARGECEQAEVLPGEDHKVVSEPPPVP
jgi:hypothetical protein